MSDHARAKAEEKINLSAKIASIVQEQLSLDISMNVKPSSMQEPKLQVEELTQYSPVHPENMKLRSALITMLKKHISRAHLSQSQAAKVFGVTQPRISDLTREKVDLFGLDALVNMATAAGLQVEINIRETK